MAKEIKQAEKGKGSLMRRQPFAEMAMLERDMERMFEDFFGRRIHPWWPERWSRAVGELPTDVQTEVKVKVD
jgi:hypothetical protein